MKELEFESRSVWPQSPNPRLDWLREFGALVGMEMDPQMVEEQLGTKQV